MAPESKRVDLAVPAFSDSTRITNPLFPISSQKSVLLLGQVDGEPFRTEVTLLPGTRVIEWQGQQVETLVSQYVAFIGGRLHEVAYDFFGTNEAREAVRKKVTALYPPHEIDQFTELFFGRIQKWREQEGKAG